MDFSRTTKGIHVAAWMAALLFFCAGPGGSSVAVADPAVNPDALREEAKVLYLRVVQEYKRRAALEDPDAQWWYNLAKPFGKIAFLDDKAVPRAILEFKQLLKQKPDNEEARRGLKLGMKMRGEKIR